MQSNLIYPGRHGRASARVTFLREGDRRAATNDYCKRSTSWLKGMTIRAEVNIPVARISDLPPSPADVPHAARGTG
jgi:hypothetical protein